MGIVRGRRRSRGQALVEFAIVVPIFMLLLGAVIQFGLLFWGQNTLNQIVRDTGRWAASQQSCDPATEAPLVVSTANTIAAQSALIGYSSWTSSNVSVSWTGSPCPPLSNQTSAWVTITITHHVPVFFPWIPGNGNLSSGTQFRMEPVPS